jgi:hypothetical protein
MNTYTEATQKSFHCVFLQTIFGIESPAYAIFFRCCPAQGYGQQLQRIQLAPQKFTILDAEKTAVSRSADIFISN